MDNTLDCYTRKVLPYIFYIDMPHIHIDKLHQNYIIFTNSSTLILIETKKYIGINADRYTYTILIDAILTLKLILIWHLINLYKRQAETRFRTE